MYRSTHTVDIMLAQRASVDVSCCVTAHTLHVLLGYCVRVTTTSYCYYYYYYVANVHHIPSPSRSTLRPCVPLLMANSCYAGV